METNFEKNLDESKQLFLRLGQLNDIVTQASGLLSDSLRNGGKLMFCGNGGSAAEAQHLASELTGRFLSERQPISAISLATDCSALSCIANDYSFDEVFSRQVIAIGRPGDVLIAMSTSGNSRNLIRAAEEARKRQIVCVGFLGNSGGNLAKLCDLAIVVPSNSTARIQECHLLIGHSLCESIERSLGFV